MPPRSPDLYLVHVRMPRFENVEVVKATLAEPPRDPSDDGLEWVGEVPTERDEELRGGLS